MKEEPNKLKFTVIRILCGLVTIAAASTEGNNIARASKILESVGECLCADKIH